MTDRTSQSIAELNAKFMGLTASIVKSQDPWEIYLKCNSIQGIWMELRSRGQEPPWEPARTRELDKILLPFQEVAMRFKQPFTGTPEQES